ncbi:MAG TPA: DNA polymerase III subunit beta [Gammaproteobacteria bacterium]|nr:DNA polymerase III subunit beta [Gammaproteobacteria bacterium]
MKLHINKQELLQPLIKVVNVVEKKQTIPILANVLIKASDEYLLLLCTDLEVESRIRIDQTHYQEAHGGCTVDAKTLLDIVRALPEEQLISLQQIRDHLQITSGKSKFSLQTLPIEDFPLAENNDWDFETEIDQQPLKRMIELCVFTMAHHDVRFFLNGMLFRFMPGKLITVATDGHRLGMAQIINDNLRHELDVIIPRKAIVEINRLLEYKDQIITLQMNKHYFRLNIGSLSFICKLIDAQYPDYSPLIPTDLDKNILINREAFLQAANRSAILCSEKKPGVRIVVTENMLTLAVATIEHENAREELSVQYNGPAFEVGYNIMYLIEAAKSMETEKICLQIGNIESGCIISSAQPMDYVAECKYLVMPIRL